MYSECNTEVLYGFLPMCVGFLSSNLMRCRRQQMQDMIYVLNLCEHSLEHRLLILMLTWLTKGDCKFIVLALICLRTLSRRTFVTQRSIVPTITAFQVTLNKAGKSELKTLLKLS